MTRLLILAPVIVMVLVACWGDSRPRPAAVESGAAPEREGRKVPLAIVVRDGAGPIAGARVAWRVTAGGGTISPAAAVTDATGGAAATWTLGPDSLTNTAEATARVGDYWEVTKFEAPAAPADTIRPFPR